MTTDVYVGGLPFSHTGVLQITARPSTGVPATADYNAGFAVDSVSNAVFALDAGAAVPVTATYSGGIAKTPDGAIYTTMVDSIGTFFDVPGGLKARSDGALLICAEEPASDARMTYLGTTGTNQGVCVGPTRNVLEVVLSDESTVANYQPGVGVTGTLNASAWANQLGAAGSLAQATGANQPIVLPFTGDKYAWNGNVAANTFTSPNKSVTGNQVFTIPLAEDDYTPAADVTLASKTSGNDGFVVKLLTTGVIRLTVGDGVGLTNVDSTVGTGLTDATKHTLTITWTDGVGAAFAIDGAALGTAVAAVKTLTNAAVAITLGPWLGKLYRYQVGSVYDFNAADWSETSTNGATQVSSTTGETWTLNNTGALLAQIVGSPSLLGNGTAHTMATAGFTLDPPLSVYVVAKQIMWTIDDYLLDGITVNTLHLKQSAVTPELLFNGAAANGNLALNTYGLMTLIANGAASSLKIDQTAATTGTNNGASLGGITLFAPGGTASNYGNFQVKEIIIRNVADSAATQAKIRSLLQSLHGTP